MLEHSVFVLIVLILYYLFCSKLFWKKNKKKRRNLLPGNQAEAQRPSPRPALFPLRAA
jgi:hypothetical protein